MTGRPPYADPLSAPLPDPNVDVRAYAIAMAQREFAAMEAADAVDPAMVAELASAARRRTTASSVVFSMRLDPAELDALERRAAVVGMKPSVFARQLVRVGLCTHRCDDVVSATLDRLTAAADELRALVT